MAGHRFRRQEPLGPDVADFCCVAARLVVELDGHSHDDPAADHRRDDWLTAEGWTVLRCGNDDVGQALDSVVERIDDALRPEE